MTKSGLQIGLPLIDVEGPIYFAALDRYANDVSGRDLRCLLHLQCFRMETPVTPAAFVRHSGKFPDLSDLKCDVRLVKDTYHHYGGCPALELVGFSVSALNSVFGIAKVDR